MKNIFLTIQDTIRQLPWAPEQKELFWRFMVVLPESDLEAISFIIKKKQEALLREYRDTHPLWQANRFSPEELRSGEPLIAWEENKYRAAFTLYQLLAGTDYSLASDWMRSSEIATKDTLRFSSLTKDTRAQEYYNRVYTLLGWTYLFTSPNWFHDLFWTSFQLIQGFRTSIDIEERLVTYLSSNFQTIAIRHETITEIQALLEKNESIIHTQDQKGGNTVKQWLEWCKAFVATSGEKDVTKLGESFLNSQKVEYDKLNESNQFVLRALISLYLKLMKGTYEIPVDPNDFLESLASLFARPGSVDMVSLQNLKPLFINWIKKCANVPDAQRKFILRFIDKVKIEKVAEQLFEINDWFKEIDPSTELDLIYANESDGQFHWNEDIVAPL